MSREDHRVYSYLSEPWRLFGFTLDECILFGSGVFTTVLHSSLFVKTIAILFGVIGVVVVKKLKKKIQGFSLKSYLQFKFGINFVNDKAWPKSCFKRWLS